ncbi:hypothetical protein O1611_g6806 [Lasiodiplodia mahajangana]|uniref:Uncharacterized protein n=1 Tax=Lasiodiplodia mahajangana TaxID=1108764 RepID=A0ACC2JH98_9PEZI|nr:hypothetical protein O1611_g6806 [Lasiodiplodia mahajangana]
MPPSRTARIPPREWEAHKHRLNQLYVERNLPLAGQNGVINIMTKEGFAATKYQYESQFRSWGWRKNMSRAEWEGIIHARERGEVAGPITLGDRVLSDARSKTALRRYRREASPVGQRVLHKSGDVAQGSTPYLTSVPGGDTSGTILPITDYNGSTRNHLSFGHTNSSHGTPSFEQLSELIHMPPQYNGEPVGFPNDPMDLVNFSMSPLQPDRMDLDGWPGFSFASSQPDSNFTPIRNVIGPPHHSAPIPQRGIAQPSMLGMVQYSGPPAVATPGSLSPLLRSQWKSPSSQFAAIIIKDIYHAAQATPSSGTALDLYGLASELLNDRKPVSRRSFDPTPIHATPLFALKYLLSAETYFGEGSTTMQNGVSSNIADKARFYSRLASSVINGFAGLQHIPRHGVLALLGNHTTTTLSLVQLLNTKPTPVAKALAENIFMAALEQDNDSLIKFLLDNTQLVHANDSVCHWRGERYTPLELASNFWSFAVIELLIERQADVNKSFKGDPRFPYYYGPLGRLIRSMSRKSAFDDRFLDIVDKLLHSGAAVSVDLITQLFYDEADVRLIVRLIEQAASQIPQDLISHDSILGFIIKKLQRSEADRLLNNLAEACQETDGNGVRHGPGVSDILLTYIREHQELNEPRFFEERQIARPTHTLFCALGTALTKAIKKGDRHYAAALLDLDSVFPNLAISTEQPCHVSSTHKCFKPTTALEAALKHDFDDIAWGIVAAMCHDDETSTDFLEIAVKKKELDLSRAILESRTTLRFSYTKCPGSLVKAAIKLGDDSIISLLSPAIISVDTEFMKRYSGVYLGVLVDKGRMDLFWGLLEGSNHYYSLALQVAITRENVPLLDELVAYGAKLNDENALEVAMRKYPSMVKPFLQRYRKAYPRGCPEFGWGSILEAINSYPKTPKRLDICFEFGLVKDNIRTIREDSTLLLKAMTSQHYKWTELSRKCVIERLLDAGSDINVIVSPRGSRITPLLQAIEMGSAEVVRLFIERGVEINTQARFGVKFTPLQKAAELNNLEIMKLLLDNGADPNSPPAALRGATALQFAAIHGNCQMAKILIEHGARLNVPPPKGPFGRWPLEGAAEAGRIDMIQLLWDENNGPFDDKQCQNAMKLAKKYGHIGCRDLIKELMETSPMVY